MTIHQEEVREMARFLMAQTGKSMVDVWPAALCLDRLKYETEVLPDKEESTGANP
jgi:hypothetical protein